MKRTLISIICLVLLVIVSGLSVAAAELEFSGGINFMTFDRKNQVMFENDESEGEEDESEGNPYFEGHPYFVGSLSFRDNITGTTSYSVNLTRDNILHNSLDARFSTKTDYFNFEVGAFFAISDSFEKPYAGIIGSIGGSYPGIAYLTLGGSSTLGSRLNFSNNDFRETAYAEIGFWLPFIIPSLSASMKSLSRQEDNITIIDSLIRYQLSADVHVKNFPVTGRVDFGYQILRQEYENNVYELKTLFTGLEAHWQVLKNVRIYAGGEMPVYNFDGSLTTPHPWKLFKASAGAVVTFFF